MLIIQSGLIPCVGLAAVQILDAGKLFIVHLFFPPFPQYGMCIYSTTFANLIQPFFGTEKNALPYAERFLLSKFSSAPGLGRHMEHQTDHGKHGRQAGKRRMHRSLPLKHIKTAKDRHNGKHSGKNQKNTACIHTLQPSFVQDTVQHTSCTVYRRCNQYLP